MARLDALTALATWNLAVDLAGTRRCRVTAALVREALHGDASVQRQRPVHLSSVTSQWHTPPSFLELVTAVFKGCRVDLDPCSDSQAQKHVQARKYFSAVEDGLTQPWEGRVFVNPPFSAQGGLSLSGAFFQKAEEEYRSGNASEVLLLMKAAVGYAWFRPVLQWPHAWLHARIAFLSSIQQAGTTNPHGSVVVYMGPDPTHFCQILSSVACIPGENSWSL